MVLPSTIEKLNHLLMIKVYHSLLLVMNTTWVQLGGHILKFMKDVFVQQVVIETLLVLNHV